MSTQTTFDNMINEYLPNSLLVNEIMKGDWLLANVEKDNSWLGGNNLVVPFSGASASAVKFGSLTAVADITQARTVRGNIENQPEVWGSLKFNEKDLVRHGRLSEQNLLRILPDQVEDFTRYMRRALSLSILNGAAFDTAAGNGSVSGTIQVGRPERFEIGQPFVLKGNVQAAQTFYCGKVNLESDVITAYTDISLTTLADLSAYTTADAAKFYFDGSEDSANSLTALKASLLSAANGGSSALYGVTKVDYPYTQAINISGASFTLAGFLDQLYGAMVRIQNKSRGNPNTLLMSWNLMSAVMRGLQVEKGAYRQANDMKINEYGFGEVTIVGPKGYAKIVGIQEMDHDYVAVLDMKALKLYSNGFIRKRVDPQDGKQFYIVRNTNGYVYVMDIAFYGDLVLERPNRCGIIHSIPAALSAATFT